MTGHQTAIVWDPAFGTYDGGFGPGGLGDMRPTMSFDQPETIVRAFEMVQRTELKDACLFLDPDPATKIDLLVQHDADYIDRVEALSQGAGGDAGFLAYVPPGGFEILLKATGSALAAMRVVLDGRARNAFAFARPGGHHALANMGMGNAVFAHVATALSIVRKAYDIPRVAIVDWDVHHGNGTEARFISDPDTLFVSVHQDRCFPKDTGGVDVRGDGQGFGANINIPLPPGAGHGAYVEMMDRVIVPALERFDPHLILVSNGVDANGTDPLGRMMCHAGTFRALSDAMVSASDRLCDGRLVVCHEGGYSTQIAPWCILAVLEGLAKRPERSLDGMSMWVAANGRHETTAEQSEVIEGAAALVDDIPVNP